MWFCQLQQELQTIKKKQEQLQKEKQLEELTHKAEQDGVRQEQQSAPQRSRERNREGKNKASVNLIHFHPPVNHLSEPLPLFHRLLIL